MLGIMPKNSIRISIAWIKGPTIQMKLNQSYINEIEAFNLEWDKGKTNAQGGEKDVINKEKSRFFIIRKFGYMASSITGFTRKTFNEMFLF